MNSHELASMLLLLPDLPVATEACNQVYMSALGGHGPLKLSRLCTYGGDHLLIGDTSRRGLNYPNWYVTEVFHGNVPNQWSYEKTINFHGDRRWCNPVSYNGPTVAKPDDSRVAGCIDFNPDGSIRPWK